MVQPNPDPKLYGPKLAGGAGKTKVIVSGAVNVRSSDPRISIVRKKG